MFVAVLKGIVSYSYDLINNHSFCRFLCGSWWVYSLCILIIWLSFLFDSSISWCFFFLCRRDLFLLLLFDIIFCNGRFLFNFLFLLSFLFNCNRSFLLFLWLLFGNRSLFLFLLLCLSLFLNLGRFVNGFLLRLSFCFSLSLYLLLLFWLSLLFSCGGILLDIFFDFCFLNFSFLLLGAIYLLDIIFNLSI